MPEVIIVGAGAAGLAAGARLTAKGSKVTILEARTRTGGRAHSLCDVLYPLDLGCGWLHSANKNPFGPIPDLKPASRRPALTAPMPLRRASSKKTAAGMR
jgi:monoamine oxidase